MIEAATSQEGGLDVREPHISSVHAALVRCRMIIVGVLLTAIQFGIEANSGTPFGAITHYVGVMVIAFGAILELLGFLARRLIQ
jgi:hypothetical protein